jgi:hypothetical protein
MASNLKDKLKLIRDLKSKGADYEVQAMFQIVELERLQVLWRKSGKTFTEVLKNERGLCTAGRFKAFKKASTCFPRKTIDQLGVPCVCILAVQNASVRNRILPHALKFRSRHGEGPTYQYVSRFFRKPSSGPTRAQALRYIDVLRKVIKDMGGSIPMMEHFPSN